MNRKEFYDILGEFFTDEADIENLERYGVESADDTHYTFKRQIENAVGDYEDFIADIGRDHVIQSMKDGSLTFGEIETIIGRNLTDKEKYDLEWRF